MIDLTNRLERAAVDLAQAEARHFETSVGTTQWDVTWHRLMAAKRHYNTIHADYVAAFKEALRGGLK